MQNPFAKSLSEYNLSRMPLQSPILTSLSRSRLALFLKLSVPAASIILLLGLVAPTASSATDSTHVVGRRAYLNCSLPHPIGVAPDTVGVSFPATKIERIATLDLSIDSLGSLGSIIPRVATDSPLVSWCEPFLRTFSFSAGRRDTLPASMKLPVDLWITPQTTRPLILFPVDSLSNVSSLRRYVQAIETNGYAVPSIQRFPPIFCVLKLPDTATSYRYTLLRLKLDQNGRVRKSSIAGTNCPDFADLILSAANWATFMPARIQKRAVSSSCFLLVVMSPTIRYPTKSWTPGAAAKLPVLEKYMLRVLPDSAELMSEPIPRHARHGEEDFPELRYGVRDSLTLFVAIDTAGYPRVIRSTPDPLERSRIEKIVTRRLRFYPALDFEGRPVPFQGLIILVALDLKKVRISYSWLP